MFIESVALVLIDYPLALVEECVDPRRGLARKSPFLAISGLIEWLDDRLEFYKGLAAWRGQVEQTRPELTPAECDKGLAAWVGLNHVLKTQGTVAAKGLTFDAAAKAGAQRLDDGHGPAMRRV